MTEPSPTARTLTTSQENREAAVMLVTGARRSLAVFSRDLEPAVYNSVKFVTAVQKLATYSSFSRVRILVIDPLPAIHAGHRLIELGQRLSSSIEFRRPSSSHAMLACAFLVVDESGYLYRPLASRYEGLADTDNLLEARAHLRIFEDIWTQAEPEPEFRRLGL
ncbi:MAG: hypothetical protein KGJ56_09010 [Gammaproteobacteria bacterium]|nr:hypothetical protein [Gammaproteobacteria bacterium]